MLDIGCGYGHIAIPLTRFLSTDGSYMGIDVMRDAVLDCQQRIGTEFDQFSFAHLDVHNGIYNADTRQPAADARFDLPDEQFDVVFMFSVFSHMMPEDVSAYLCEIGRWLKPGGMLMTTFFILNNFSRSQIESGETRRTFAHKYGGVFIDDPSHPETAVAYEQPYLEDILTASPLQHVHTFYGQWAGHRWSMTGQDAVICVKP